MHFFNPVNRMPLVEIIRGEKTDDKTIAKLVKITRNLGKTPIVVKDVSGFLVNRILLPYILEASYLALEGAQITNIDQAMEKFGMPMGPFILADTVGIDVGIKVMHSLHNAYKDRMKISQLMIEIEGHKDLLGKKSNQGFYLYSKNKSNQKPIFNPKIDEIIYNIRKQNNSETKSFYSEEIVERLMLVMINESAKCLEENVVKNASYLDLAMIMGAGFPAFEGGVLRYADKIGINKVVAKLQNLNTKFQLRYQVSNLLLEMAKNNQKFY
jgi:3-hydroxyacyl-CoA dehydrogenase/enoyl-CoA hydratase/3-hydroxybutyryl-CoA epimerase